MSRITERERQTAAVLLVVFSALTLGMLIFEVILATNTEPNTTWSDFVSKSRISFVMPYFLAYLVIGAAGFAGTVGLVQVYGQGQALLSEIVRLSALAYFTVSCWLWSAVWIVEHKITLLTDTPTAAPEWLLRIYDATGALWALPSWGSLGPAIVTFAGLAWLLNRGVTLLARSSAALFALLAVSRIVDLVYLGVTEGNVANTGAIDFAFVNDLLFATGRIGAFLLAAAALFVEKGVFRRRTRVA
ncbi:MAG: hypothetical protein Kow0062_02620 [Acidobacteriota bacterium]|nr:MAG: hypothetical protein D6738_14365 [Acidobacteriota bacterium]